MKKIINALLNPDYVGGYLIYKRLPGVTALMMILASVVWSLIDVTQFSVRRGYTYEYGLWGLSDPFLCVLIWIVIGFVAALLVWTLLTVIISPTIVRTDAVLEISASIVEKTPKTEQTDSPKKPSKAEEKNKKTNKVTKKEEKKSKKQNVASVVDEATKNAAEDDEYVDVECPHCGERLSFDKDDQEYQCPFCDYEFSKK